MTDEAAQQRTLETFLRRNLADGGKTVSDLKDISLAAFAAQADGTTAIEVTFEGGATRASVNCAPHILLAASETVIAENDATNPLANASLNQRYADMSGGRIET